MSKQTAQNNLQVDSIIKWLQDGVIKAPTFIVDGSVPEQFATDSTTCVIVEGGVMAGIGPQTQLDFTAAHVITASKFGGGIFQCRRKTSGNPLEIQGYATKVPGVTQTTPMAYDSAQLAQDAIDLLVPDAGYIKVGEFLIENNAGDWTAGTDDITDGSDVATCDFTSVAEKTLPTPL